MRCMRINDKENTGHRIMHIEKQTVNDTYIALLSIQGYRLQQNLSLIS